MLYIESEMMCETSKYVFTGAAEAAPYVTVSIAEPRDFDALKKLYCKETFRQDAHNHRHYALARARSGGYEKQWEDFSEHGASETSPIILKACVNVVSNLGDDAQIVGLAVVVPSDEQSIGSCGALKALCVDQDYVGQKVDVDLYVAASQALLETGALKMNIETLVGDGTLQQCLDYMGMRYAGSQMTYFPVVGDDTYIMNVAHYIEDNLVRYAPHETRDSGCILSPKATAL